MQLHNQLLFYRHLFDAEKAVSQLRGSARGGQSTHTSQISRRATADFVAEEVNAVAMANQNTLTTLIAVVDKYLDRNGRRFVDMKGLFGFMEKIRL